MKSDKLNRNFLTWLVPGVFIATIFFVNLTQAEPNEIYSFNSKQKRFQFEEVIHEMRCLVCRNQNLADSNAPLANDLRLVIYQRILRGESVDQIKNYLISRYGDFISFKPMFSRITFFLWLSPFILLLAVLSILLIKFKKFDARISKN
jgi:cytochrome c-type biogenesis protein CcmH